LSDAIAAITAIGLKTFYLGVSLLVIIETAIYSVMCKDRNIPKCPAE
jgi:uncharacterized membrane protein YdjX (TVP38/TMEM64 family)